MKKTTSIVILAVAVILTAFISCSCSKVTDAQIATFEKSIEKLNESYKDLTPRELEKAINLCEKQLELLTDTDRELTPNQQKRIANLTGRYHRLLIEIELYTTANEIFGSNEGESALEYLHGLLTGDK